MPEEPLDFESFTHYALAVGLQVPADELAEMHEGYVGLRQMLRLLPGDLDAAAEPVTVFRPDAGGQP